MARFWKTCPPQLPICSEGEKRRRGKTKLFLLRFVARARDNGGILPSFSFSSLLCQIPSRWPPQKRKKKGRKRKRIFFPIFLFVGNARLLYFRQHTKHIFLVRGDMAVNNYHFLLFFPFSPKLATTFSFVSPLKTQAGGRTRQRQEVPFFWAIVASFSFSSFFGLLRCVSVELTLPLGA